MFNSSPEGILEYLALGICYLITKLSFKNPSKPLASKLKSV